MTSRRPLVFFVSGIALSRFLTLGILSDFCADPFFPFADLPFTPIIKKRSSCSFDGQFYLRLPYTFLTKIFLVFAESKFMRNLHVKFSVFMILKLTFTATIYSNNNL